MRAIKAEPISKEAYAPFGVYYDYLNPEGYALEGEIHKQGDLARRARLGTTQLLRNCL